jgi:serine phosphatase RsbU (regulator of sigma subunit)
VLQVGVLGAAVLIPAGLIARTEQQLREELDSARRREEVEGDVGTIIEAITGEMSVSSPDVPGWSIGTRYRPATGHLAGDSVQVHHREQPRGATLIAIIDIAGHDAHAAVVAYGLRAHIGALWESGADLVSTAASANARLVRQGTIATGVLLAIEHDSHDVHVVNAGHPSPLHVHGSHVSEWTRTGPLFGLPDTRHTAAPYTVHPGDLVVAYTDGLIEARSTDGRQLGEPMLRRVIHAFQQQPVDAIAAACLDAALEHTAARLSDDALVVVARRSH